MANFDPPPFHLPKSLSDENEFGLGKTPYYFTYQEFGIAVMVLIFSYVTLSFIIHNAIIVLVLTALITMFFLGWLNRVRKGKPASYIWDWRYKIGTFRSTKGLLPARPMIYTWSPRGIQRRQKPQADKRSGFILNSKRGERRGFTLDSFFRQTCYPHGKADDPILTPLPFFRERIIISYDFSKKSPAPIWVHRQPSDSFIVTEETIHFDIKVEAIPMESSSGKDISDG